MIDTGSNTVTAAVTVGARPYGVAVNPAGTRVYVTNWGANAVSVIDTASNTVTATVTVGTSPGAFGLFIGGAAAPPTPPTITNGPPPQRYGRSGLQLYLYFHRFTYLQRDGR